MKPFRQYLSLLNFHLFANPWMWLFPLAFLPMVFYRPDRYHFDLSVGNLGVMQFAWMPLLFASFLFGSQMFAGMSGTNFSTNLQIQAFDLEFLLTRPVDRANVYWSRATIYWLLILLPIASWIVAGLFKSSFTLELRPDRLAYYLQDLPGSFVEGKSRRDLPVLVMPWGNLWLALWNGMLLLLSAAFWQAFVFVILPFRLRRWFYWGAFVLCMAGNIFLATSARKPLETAFLFCVNHTWLCLLIVAVAMLGTLRFCRARFLAQECA